MKIDISVEIFPDSTPTVSLAHSASLMPEIATVIPQVNFSSARAIEVRELGGGKRISQEQMFKELDALGDGWRLETRQELYALVDLQHKNQHGAYSQDPTLQPEPYWSADKHPLDPAARVVVWFVGGLVYSYYGYLHARARAVRVSGQ